MKNIDTHIKSSKYKKRRQSSANSSMTSQISSDSDNDSFPLAKDSNLQEGEEDNSSSNSSTSSSPYVKKCKKKKRCRHKRRSIEISSKVHIESELESQKFREHHHHKRHYKRKDSGRDYRKRCDEEVRIKMEHVDHQYSAGHPHSSRKRPLEDRERVKLEKIHHNNHYSRHRQHHKGRNRDQMRHRRGREEGEPSYERESHHQHSSGEGRRSSSHTNRSNSRNKEIPVHANRPIKQEQVSDEEPEFGWGKKSDAPKDNKKIPVGDKDKPNFGLSGKLVEDTNVFNGVVIKYSEPPEAHKPKRRWRFYPFKGDQGLPTLYIHRQSCYLMGRDRKVADIPIDHPSCSKQHAALQYRLVPFQRDNGTTGRRVRPYIIDLESANGTFVNNVKIEPKKYVELLERDVIKFGYSSREYVLLHEHSKDDELDDDVAAAVEDE